MRLRLNDTILYLLALANALRLIVTQGLVFAEDSQSYLNAWHDSLALGLVDFTRTPTYPIILASLEAVGGSRFELLLIVVQHFVFLLSVWVFRKLTRLLLSSSAAGWWLTLIYALLPYTTMWANRMLTETFAIAGTVFLFHQLVLFHQRPTLKRVFASTLWLLFLVFLRPAFLYLLPVCLLGWLMFWRRSARLARFGLLGVALVTLLEVGYCARYEARFGLFAPTNVSTVNFTYLAFHDGLMRPEYSDDPAFRSFIEHYDGSEPISYCPFPTIEQYGLTVVADAIRASQHDQPLQWAMKALHRFVEAADPHFAPLTSPRNLLVNAAKLVFNFATLYLFLLLFSILLIRRFFVRTSSLPKGEGRGEAPSLLLLAVVGNLFTAIVGAQGEWLRLITPSLPLLLLMAGLCFCAIFKPKHSI